VKLDALQPSDAERRETALPRFRTARPNGSVSTVVGSVERSHLHSANAEPWRSGSRSDADARRLTGPSARAHAWVLLLRVIVGNYAAGSIRVVMAIRFQALITVIAHTS
jgi:hypothetical protein